MPIVVNGMRRRAIKHRYSSKYLNYLPKNLQKKIAFIQEKKKNIIENMIKNKAALKIQHAYKNTVICAICHTLVYMCDLTKCCSSNHYFHVECCTSMIKHNCINHMKPTANKCPVCRESFTIENDYIRFYSYEKMQNYLKRLYYICIKLLNNLIESIRDYVFNYLKYELFGSLLQFYSSDYIDKILNNYFDREYYKFYFDKDISLVYKICPNLYIDWCYISEAYDKINSFISNYNSIIRCDLKSVYNSTRYLFEILPKLYNVEYLNDVLFLFETSYNYSDC